MPAPSRSPLTGAGQPAGTTGWTHRWIYDGIVPDGTDRATLPADSLTDFAERLATNRREKGNGRPAHITEAPVASDGR